jgi:hypothetical protein
MSESKAMTAIKLFISHSQKDAALATLLVHCLEACLLAEDGTIRCTSVPGYELEPGVNANETIRQNIKQCSVMIGLLTEDSLQSGYVIMELGAAWGLEKLTCPVLAPTVAFNRIPGPLATTHAIKLDDPTRLVGLIEVISREAAIGMKSQTKITAAVHAFLQKVTSGP